MKCKIMKCTLMICKIMKCTNMSDAWMYDKCSDEITTMQCVQTNEIYIAQITCTYTFHINISFNTQRC